MAGMGIIEIQMIVRGEVISFSVLLLITSLSISFLDRQLVFEPFVLFVTDRTRLKRREAKL